jgi:hypothetical protein
MVSVLDFKANKRFNDEKLQHFAFDLREMAAGIGFKVSSRGWCYLLENARVIDKDGFDRVEELINACRRKGFLSVDFVAEEDARAFSGLSKPTDGSIKSVLQWMCSDVLTGHTYYEPDWWEDEEYYVQMLVEKIDLKTLFAPVADEYHIPIANAKGWSSILQRAEYARRFKEAEDRGLKCVLLYCGDHDPDGVRISDALRDNLNQIAEVRWSDGEEGYDPADLQIERFGLNYDFIVRQGYTWIDNLITGSKKNLASPSHPNHRLPYVQRYLREYGPRKCEANAVVTTPDAARDLVREAIESIVGDALPRFAEKRRLVEARYAELLEQTKLSRLLTHVVESDDEEDN